MAITLATAPWRKDAARQICASMPTIPVEVRSIQVEAEWGTLRRVSRGSTAAQGMRKLCIRFCPDYGGAAKTKPFIGIADRYTDDGVCHGHPIRWR